MADTPNVRRPDPYAVPPNMPVAKKGEQRCEMVKCPYKADPKCGMIILGKKWVFCSAEHRALASEWTRGISMPVKK